MNKISAYLLMMALLCAVQTSFATITVDSVVTSPSTCVNNGTATIYASSNSSDAVFIYNIIRGPVTFPLQNDSLFTSLFPGQYTAWVHDVNSFDSTETTFTVAGNYLGPEPGYSTIAPVCVGDSNGYIVCMDSDAANGDTPPYTWQIVSPDSGIPQTGDTIFNLPSAHYTIKMTDGCNVSRLSQVVLGPGGIGLAPLNDYVTFIGCDTGIFTYQLLENRASFVDASAKVTITTGSKTITQIVWPDTSGSPSFPSVSDTLYNIDYGDTLQMCFTDTCGVTECLTDTILSHFNFSITPVPRIVNCVPMNYYEIFFNGDGITTNQTNPPIFVSVEGLTSLTVVDTFTSYGLCAGNCPLIPPLDTGQKYSVTISDRCGHVYHDTITPVPISYTPSVSISYGLYSCTDSTGSVNFNYSGFTSPPVLTITSGPPYAQSTKPLFAYKDSITYPLIYTTPAPAGNFPINRTPPGTYTYTLADTCGHVISGTFRDSLVLDLDFSGITINTCSGIDTFKACYVNPFTEGLLTLLNDNLTTYYGNYNNGCLSIPAPGGTYAFRLAYNNVGLNYIPQVGCWNIYDTITLDSSNYNNNLIAGVQVLGCRDSIYIDVEVDSAHGLAPFQYSIISGPETIAPQSSNLLEVHDFGVYNVYVTDACGDQENQRVGIDTVGFTPVIKGGGWCPGTLVELSNVVSPYFTYVWREPSGMVFTGDTLLINPFTPADTGIYLVQRDVDIRGCRDTAYGNYDLMFKDTFQVNKYYCPGDTLFLGTQSYSSDTILYDTLTSSYGCDSIAITIISKDIPLVSISPANPQACRPSPILLTASAGSSYLWSNSSTLNAISVNPDTATTYTVTVTDFSGCSATASVQVLPASYDSIGFNQTLCSGDTFHIGIHAYTQAGTYLDTLTAVQGCDSLVTTLLRVLPSPQAGISPSNPPVCHAGSITLTASGGDTYTWNDSATSSAIIVNPSTVTTYRVTVTDANNCTASAYVVINPASDTAVQVTSAQTTICSGDTATFCTSAGFSAYYWNTGDTSRCIPALTAGNYLVTVTNNLGCIATGSNALHIYPDIPISLSVRGDTLTCNNNTTYQWYFNGAAIPGATNNVLIAKQSGDYTIEVTDANGCSYFSTAQKITTGINALISADGVKLYPNPNTGAFTLEFSDDIQRQIEITDAIGRVIIPLTKVLRKQDFNITCLADGVYILNIYQADDSQSLRFSVVR